MPRHVGQRTIYHHEEENHEKHIAREPHSLSKRTRDERRRDDGKLHLKQCIESQRNSGSAKYLSRRRGINIASHVLEHKECGGIADDTCDVVAKTQREAEHHPQHRDNAHGNETLKHC